MYQSQETFFYGFIISQYIIIRIYFYLGNFVFCNGEFLHSCLLK